MCSRTSPSLSLVLRMLSIAGCLSISACASYTPRIAPEAHATHDSDQETPPSGTHRIFLIGDTGNTEALNAPLLALRKRLLKSQDEGYPTTVLFLGDNIYPLGLPAKEHKNRGTAEARLNVILQTLEGFHGRAYVVPGNHDEGNDRYSTKRTRRQERYLEKGLKRHGIQLLDQDIFRPSEGCGDPELIELDENLALVLLNSQWFIRDWSKDPGVNKGCTAKNRVHFLFQLELLLRKNRDKRVIVAAHHPLLSYGPHGGKFTLKEHLTPLPILGSLKVALRSSGFVPQGQNHPSVRAYIDTLKRASIKNGSYIFVAGHEHNLQYSEFENQIQIISGSGSKQSPAKLSGQAHYVSGSKGFAELRFYPDQRASVHFFNADNHQEFATELPAQTKTEKVVRLPPPPQTVSQSPQTSTVTKNPVQTRSYIGRLLFGKTHRPSYRIHTSFETLKLSTFEGGARPVKAGGGNQTNSIRLIDPSGQQWALRAMTKDATRTLPYPFNRLEPLNQIAADVFTATYPYGALIVADLAETAAIYHSKPKLVWVPDQSALGDYRSVLRNEVALLERRAEEPNDGPLPKHLGGTDGYINTLKVIERLHNNPVKHRVDEPFVIRNRLFDFLIGDWDRHDDQWRWAVFEQEDGSYLYRPVPRDRDQAFAHYDGLFLSIARWGVNFARQMRPYTPHTGNMKWASYNSRMFDETFLPKVSWDVVRQQAESLQAALSDEAIDRAFGTISQEALQSTRVDIKSVFKQRRDRLLDIARHYYEYLVKTVEITGSDDRDHFSITIDDHQVRILAQRKKDKEAHTFFDATYDDADTQEIRIYALEGKDRFDIQGQGRSRIRIRLIGGPDKDKLSDHSAGKHNIYYYDSKSQKGLVKTVKDRRSDYTHFNQYHRRDRHYEIDSLHGFPTLNTNPDDGVFLGYDLTFTQHGFKKSPYKDQHRLHLDFSTETQSAQLVYDADWSHALGRFDITTGAALRAPTFTRNYFGLTNRALDPGNRNFNRLRNASQQAHVGIRRRMLQNRVSAEVQIYGLYSDIEATAGRFISDPLANIPNRVFSGQSFAGTRLSLTGNTFDNPAFPKHGMGLRLTLDARDDVERRSGTSSNIDLQARWHWVFDRKQRVVMSSSVRGAGLLGDGEFFFAPTLGGDVLRAYRREQLAGQAAFAQSNDLRIQTLRTRRGIPVTMGVSLGLDHGRVWTEQDSDERYHVNYGLGLWLSIVERLGIQAEYFRSVEGIDRLTVNIGSLFAG